MPDKRYQQIRRRFMLAVTIMLAVLVGLLVWESLYDYQRITSEVPSRHAEFDLLWFGTLFKHGTVAFLMTVFIVINSFLFLRQIRRLEMSSLQLEAQQYELAVKAAMIDSALDAIILLDENGRLLQFNNALCVLTGRGRQELEAMSLQDIVYAGESRHDRRSDPSDPGIRPGGV